MAKTPRLRPEHALLDMRVSTRIDKHWYDALFAQANSTTSGGGTVDWVNVRDHGAVGDGVADDTASIQAAIDFASTNGISTIYVPSGIYKTSASIYLDPPDNLRLAPLNVNKRINFMLALVGDEGCGYEGGGTRIQPTNNSFPGLIVGGGQAMVLKQFTIAPNVADYRANNPALVPAIGIGSGNGATRSWIEKVFAANYYTGFQTGYLGTALGDSNTFVKCRTLNCALGVWINNDQNFINSFYDCNIEATTGILCSNGGGAQIFGGNWSAPTGQAGVCAVSSVSALTAVAFGNTFTYTFTATVTADAFFTGPEGVYNAFVFNTVHFGMVPATLQDFTAGVATFKLYQPWVETLFGIINIQTTTDLQAELQACGKVYCVERLTTFRGTNISVQGIHIENFNSPTCFINSEVTFGNNRPCRLQNVYFNTDASLASFGEIFSPADADLGRHLVAKTFPFIEVKSSEVHISDSNLGLIDTVPVIANNQNRLVIERCVNFRPQLMSGGGGGGIGIEDRAPLMELDRYYFWPAQAGNNPYAYDDLARNGNQVAPYWVSRPAPYATPAVKISDFNTLSGALPALSVSTGPAYPMIWGGQVYRKYDFYTGATATYQFVSNHRYYSYGQDLTTTNVSGLSWSYKGRSPCVYMDANALKLMRIGLGILLFDGISDVRYIITGIFPLSRFVTVTQDPIVIDPTSGNKNTVFTGTLIKQDAYSITSF